MFYLNKCRELYRKYCNSESSSVQNNATDNDVGKMQIQNNILIGNNPLVLPIDTVFLNISSRLQSIDETITQMEPTVPLFCIRPKIIEAAANYFVSIFPGEVLYAVKCNPDPNILKLLWNGGIRHFDCASIKEIELVRTLIPSAEIHFMHPVKTKNAIYKAYFNYNIRDYALDSLEELYKITEVTKNGDDLGLLVRIQVAENATLYDLSHKYGASVIDAVAILREARPIAKRLGICFHVGSQCIEPKCYEDALAIVKDIFYQVNVKIDIIDVGGGFPATYPDCLPPPLNHFFLSIERGFRNLNLPKETILWCEPGRALVSAGCSIVVTVLACRGDKVYINDGAYGSLGDAGPMVNNRYPVRLIRRNKSMKTEKNNLKAFQFYGPTCDSQDLMKGPFKLPDDVKTDDYIEIGETGAYSIALKTPFNGFDETMIVFVSDDPLMVVS